MTTSTSVHSNAFNFMSALKGGVDPRTGQYTVSVSLPETFSNDLRGPGIALAMSFNPLNTLDSGFGLGWTLQLSQYTPHDQVLSLSTGETFKVTGRIVDSAAGKAAPQYGEANPGDLLIIDEPVFDGDRLTMKEQKIDSFHFYEQTDGRYRVMHKSGLVEILEVHGSSDRRVALPVEIYSAQGHKISLAYQTFSSIHVRLASISDASGNVLMQVKREDNSVEIQMHPYDGPEGTPLAKFVMSLVGTEKRVTEITLPTDESASWRFGYEDVLGHTCMSWVETPTGAREVMYYRDAGHTFPASSVRRALPRVTHHLTYPGSDTPTEVRYTYPINGNNFLGNGLSVAWTDDGLDNLYKYNGTYDYGSTETLWVDDKAVRSIDRTFNQFHLLTRERTTQNNTVQEAETVYHLTPNTRFEDQPSICQLPKNVTTRWWLTDDATRQRNETVSTTFDRNGNLLTKTNANGIIETRTWYPAAGAVDCPPDPEGFVRQLMDTTVTPAPSTYGQAPTLVTRYSYMAVRPLTGSGLTHWLTAENEILVERIGTVDNELQRTQFSCFDVPDNPLLHGRAESVEVTLNNKTNKTLYSYLKLDREHDDNPSELDVLQTVETLIGFDDLAQIKTRHDALLTGKLLLINQDSVEVRYRYDLLGRVTEETEGAGTPFQATRRYEYSLSTASGRASEQILYNAKNVKTTTRLDGLNRVIFEERDDPSGGLPRKTYSAAYDALGRLTSESQFDWIQGQEAEFTSRFKYDDWGQQCCVTGNDDVEVHEEHDPIGSLQSKGPIMRSWRQSSGSSPLTSARQVTWFNLFAKPTQERTLSADEKEEDAAGITRTFEYDGIGRCTRQVDQLKRETRFTYDVWSRMLGTTLPDTTEVTRTYADHSAAELQIAVHVGLGDADNTQVVVGKQTFDGLERRTAVTVGTQTEAFVYVGSQSQPSQRVTAAGHAIEYDYNLILTDTPIASRAPDEHSTYTYDITSARLTSTLNPLGERRYDYNAANQLISEHWTDNNKTNWETLYVSSLQDRPLQRTDPGGLTTDYTYDNVGRVSSIKQGQVLASFDYDRLGQLSQTRCQDIRANTTLITDLEYDDQGRETLRTQSLGTRPTRTLSQTWKIDSMLETRHLQENGITLLMETFSYDQRGRLSGHDCSGTTLPRDPEGREITQQIFTFDNLDNIKLSMTTFADGASERVLFTYAPDNPCQLQSVNYIGGAGEQTFQYDADGNMLNDEQGNTLNYDSQGRLLEVLNPASQTLSQYQYDSLDQMVTSQRNGQTTATHFYQGTRLSNTIQDQKSTAYLYLGEQPLAQQQANDASQTLLLLTDANHSVLAESQQSDLRTAVYNAYGERSSDDGLLCSLGFNGEVRDEVSGWYLLGQGYRAYNPGLMRFHSPDFLSPFGAGGLNPYTYCLGNPIALRDPTGHAPSGSSGRLRRPDEDQLANSAPGGDFLGDLLSYVGVAVGAAVSAYGLSEGITLMLDPLTFAGGLLLTTASALGLASSAMAAVSIAKKDVTLGYVSAGIGLLALPAMGASAVAKGMAEAAQAAFSVEKALIQPFNLMRGIATSLVGVEAESVGMAGGAAVAGARAGSLGMIPRAVLNGGVLGPAGKIPTQLAPGARNVGAMAGRSTVMPENSMRMTVSTGPSLFGPKRFQEAWALASRRGNLAPPRSLIRGSV